MKRYNPETKPEPVGRKDVGELLDSAGLKRCACGTPIPDNCEQCIKCKKLKGQ